MLTVIDPLINTDIPETFTVEDIPVIEKLPPEAKATFPGCVS